MTVVIPATVSGGRLAADLADHLGGRVAAARPAEAVRDAWAAADAIVLVMAVGAAVRLVAPHLDDKHADPGVVCVDTAGRFAVALTGGHEGGANALADRIAAHLHATSVVTTASEAAGHLPLGDLGARHGVTVEGDVAAVAGAVLAGEAPRLWREVAWPLGPVAGAVEVADADTGPLLWLTDRVVAPAVPTVLLRPPSLVVGVGASRGVTMEEVRDLVDRALADAGLSPASVAHLTTADVKADEAGILEAAAARGWEVVTHPAEALAATRVPNPSEVVAAAVGTPSVAEAAAVQQGGHLVVEKTASAMATVAIARRRARGHLALVSLGPGSEDLVPPMARDVLRHAEVVVGYGPYVDQASAFVGRGAALERFGLGDEVARADRAIALAREGRSVALVGSGDVGVYAMASPTLERVPADVDVTIVPGVTAALAASALLGAPFGHDHCSISLSDLLTPWERIRARVEAAAAGDLAVALYNPRSRLRHWQLAEAVAILRAHRPDDTPVGVVRDAFRPDQQVQVTTLGELDVTTVQMTTVVLVGASHSRLRHGRIVTPRGYREVPA